MRVIGLCGRSGSGKSQLCKIAMKHGIKVVDCDKVYRELVSYKSDCLLEIAEHFGNDVIKNSALDRRYLAPIVFSDQNKLNLLNKITHKHITAEIKNIFSNFSNSDIVILDAPTLFESGLNSICDFIIAVVADDSVAIQRIVKRDNISEAEAIARLSNQKTISFFDENCDCVIHNNSTLEDFEKEAEKLIRRMKEATP